MVEDRIDMSGILSVKDRIAMMNTSKAKQATPPEPTASIDNPVRKTGSIADKIAALKASTGDKSEPQQEKVFTTQSPIAAAANTSSLSRQASNNSSETTESACGGAPSAQAEESQPVAPVAERRLSIKDRIAAMKGGAVPIIAPAPGPAAVSRPSIVGTSRPLPVPSPSQPSVENAPDKEPEPLVEKPSEPAVNAGEITANSGETKEEPKVQSVSVEKLPESVVVTEEVKASEPAVVEAPVTQQVPVPVQGQTADKAPEKESDASSEPSSGSKANSIASKIAALKQQQQQAPKPAESAAQPENKDRRRLSTDLKNFGAKIALPMPGAPRPVFRPPPSSDDKDSSEQTSAGASRGSTAVDENGELKHVSLCETMLCFGYDRKLTSLYCVYSVEFIQTFRQQRVA